MEAATCCPAAEGRATERRRGLDAIICLGLILVALLGYLRTMRPTFGWGDSSELITAAYHLGVGHSPGYPTWMLIMHPFSRIPVGDVAFRVNFMTAFLGAVAVRGVADPTGTLATVVEVVATGSLVWWALDEVIRGVNPWRRLLGLGGCLLVVSGLVARLG